MRVQELIELLQKQSPCKAVCFDLGDDSLDILDVEDSGSCVLLVPELDSGSCVLLVPEFEEDEE